jgi:hypothetical protein
VATKETDLPGDSAPKEPKKPRKAADRQRLVVVLGVLIVAGGIFFLANREDPAAVDDGKAAEDDFATFTDREAGFSVKLPRNWQFFEQQQRDPQIRFVAGPPGAPQNNLRVRVSPLAQPVVIDRNTPDTVLAEFQAQFDKYIDDGENVREVLQRRRVNINGVEGWWYLYSFNDNAGNEEGLHSHFFLLGGNKMFVIVFQALPTAAYEDYAKLFDEIITSFTILEPQAASPAESPPEG